MKRIRYHYKVVSKISGSYYSALAKDKAKTHYQVGKWVKAPDWLAEKGRHLTVFKCKFSAIDFIDHNSEVRCPKIFRCLVKNSVRRIQNKCSLHNLSYGKIYPIGDNWPQGTKFYKQVKLIEKVKE
jgi:hypothetical protein